MITKQVWNDWINALIQYAKENYPEVNISEERVIDFAFKSLRTIHMEPIIIDIKEFDEEE